jgi:hypothetical protein
MPGVASLETLTRIGFAARGVLYLIIGYLALRTGGAAGKGDAIAYVRDSAGDIVLVLMALGFTAYGLWRLSEALLDTEGHGHDAKGIGVRIGGAASGLIHLVLAFYALRLTMGDGGQAGGDGTTENAATALSLPGGPLLLSIAAVGIIATGLYQLVKAIKLDFRKHLDPSVARSELVGWIGRIGYTARGIVFAVIGWFLWNAAQHSRAAEAGGTEEAMASLPDTLRILVAIGFVLFGVFSLVEARYRRITDPHVISRLKRRAQAI